MTGLRADFGFRFLSPAEPFFSPAVDVFHQFRREFHELAPIGLLQSDGKQGTQVLYPIALFKESQRFPHDFAGVVIATG